MSSPVERIKRWMVGTSEASVQRAAQDLQHRFRGRLHESNHDTRYTMSGLSKRHYAALRAHRDELDCRNWNAHTGYSGLSRGPTGPGVISDGQERRRNRSAEVDDGF